MLGLAAFLSCRWLLIASLSAAQQLYLESNVAQKNWQLYPKASQNSLKATRYHDYGPLAFQAKQAESLVGAGAGSAQR